MSSSALILLMDDSARTGLRQPLLLTPAMGAPLLSWLAAALAQRGICRYALVCQERFAPAVAPCFPEGAELTICTDHSATQPLLRFLSHRLEQTVLVITGACVCLPSGGRAEPTCACHVPYSALVDALDGEDFSFCRFLRTHAIACTEADGLYPVASLHELNRGVRQMHDARLSLLMQQGVQLWDGQHCYIDPGVSIGAGTVVLPGAILRGHTVIGRDCVIGANAMLENTHLGNGCHIGASQLYESQLGSDCSVDAFCDLRGTALGNRVRVGSSCTLNAVALGDSTHVGAGCTLRTLTAGRSCRLGAGCLTGTQSPDACGAITLEDDTALGAGVILTGGCTVGRSAGACAGVTLSSPVPAQAVAASRSKPTLRKARVLHNKYK